jgi:hypothetical protein
MNTPSTFTNNQFDPLSSLAPPAAIRLVFENQLRDIDGNVAEISYWGSREAAEKSLASLTACAYCYNCSDCGNRSGCTECSGIKDSIFLAHVVITRVSPIAA